MSFFSLSISHKGDFRVIESSFLHSFWSSKCISSYQNYYFTGKVGEVNRFFHSCISSSDYYDFFISKDWESSITNCTSRDSFLPKFGFTFDSHSLGCCSCCDDECVCSIGFISDIHFERFTTQVYWIYSKCLDLCSRIEWLLSHVHHEFRTINSCWESREIFNYGCSCELSSSGDSSCHKSFKH